MSDIEHPSTPSAPSPTLIEPSRRVVKGIHSYATVGSKTERGGEVSTASTDICVSVNGKSLRVACVGDLVRYADGTTSKIVSGAGMAATFHDLPIAIVGSHVENGDTVIDSPQVAIQLARYIGESICGFLEPGYLPPTHPTKYPR